MNESAGASAVKVVAVTTGAAMSGMDSVAQSIGVTGQDVIWFLTVAYGILQIYKSIPWVAMQTIAIWRGIRRHDWTAFKQIASREETAKDDES